LRLEGATQPRYTIARYLYYLAMLAACSEAAAMQIMPVGWTIAVMVAVDEPDRCLL
jgi:hypothetical protein